MTGTDEMVPIAADAAHWHELEHQIDGALAERAKRKKGLPDKFRDLLLDPRGARKAEWLSVILPAGEDPLGEYQTAWKETGLGEINDQLEALWDQQDQITERLLAARPQSIAEALTLVGVGVKLLAGAVDAGDDYMVKIAKAVQRFFADAERLAAKT